MTMQTNNDVYSVKLVHCSGPGLRGMETLWMDDFDTKPTTQVVLEKLVDAVLVRDVLRYTLNKKNKA